MKKLMFLPLIAMMMVACSSDIEMASQAEQYETVPFSQAYEVQVVVKTDTLYSSIYQTEIPSTTEFWQRDAEGEWTPKMDLITDLVNESVEMPAVHEGEAVTGRFALMRAIPRDNSQGPSTFQFTNQDEFFNFVSACWDPQSIYKSFLKDQSQTCWEGAAICRHRSSDNIFIWCLMGF